MIILLLRIVMVLFVIWLFAALIKDYKESGTKLSEVSMGEKAAYAVMGFVLNLLETALTGAKLIISIVINFVLGMLMCAGVGLYAPCMALCALMGLNITVAFPIMMGSCALLMPPASMEFIKAGRYNRKAALIASVTGILGVLAAYYIVKSMPVDILTYIVAVVLIYMAITFIISNKKDKENKAK